MKKTYSVPFLALTAVLALTGCSSNGAVTIGDWANITKTYLEETDIGTNINVDEGKLTELGFSEENPLKIALVTDSGTLWDHSFNQSAYEGLNDFAVKNGGGTYNESTFVVNNGIIQTAYYQPTEYDTSHRLEAMRTAVTEFGASVIVLPGYLFQGAIKLALDDETFDNVSFLAMDCQQLDDSNQPYEYTDQVTSLVYREEQSGFLAGYAAVQEGYRKLGFVGGMEVPAVIRYGSGYMQGAAYAAEELGLESPVEINTYYAGEFAATAAATAMATSWYNSGTEVIFACGGAVYNSVVSATIATGYKPWIGVDVNQHADTVGITDEKAREACITSAMKNLSETVQVILASYVNNDLAWTDDLAAKVVTVGASSDMCKLPTPEADNDPGCWGFENFTEEEYNEVYNLVKNGTIKVNSNSDGDELRENNFGVNPEYAEIHFYR